jgi:broad specificity phosphatase PhoE
MNSTYLRGLFLSVSLATCCVQAADPLPSWNEGASKLAIIAFVGSAAAVPESERLAVFDNDGTLWCEQPLYTQLQFAIDRVKALADENPRWKRKQPFKKLFAASGDEQVAVTQEELMEVVMASHAGMTTEEFEQTVRDWLATARHPKTGRPYPEMVYQPMLEVLDYFRDNGFKTYIVSGGGVEFMRVFAEEVYGVPPEQVIGSSIKTKYEVNDGEPSLVRLPEIEFINDKAGKPVGIHKFIGRRPLAAFGNSDGDFQMLEWTTAGAGDRFGLLVHHDDAQREYAYDRDSHIGGLDRGLEEAPARNWTVVSIKDDWKVIYPPQ